jgi:heme exporter protein D
MDVAAFVSMGGYAVYVWPSYGIALLVLLVNAVLPHRQERALRARIAARAAHAERNLR